MKKEEKEYVPYGKEWERMLMAWTKKDLIMFLRKILMEQR